MLITSLIAYGFAVSKRKINKVEGVILISLYVAYMAFVIWKG